MISIIISTYRPELLQAVSANIAATIGVPFEIVAIENKGAMGICRAYNLGVEKARYDYLCFAHEDICLLTQNWGNIVLDLFGNDRQLGLLGVAGNVYKSLMPSHWSFAGASHHTFVQNVIQRHKNNQTTHRLDNPYNEKLTQVAAIDGLWFCTTKKIATELPFNDTYLEGFHGYDLDYSLKINVRYKVAVTFEILMEHFSEGGFNKSWISDMFLVHQKWKHILPLNIRNFDQAFMRGEEKEAFKSFVRKMMELRYPVSKMLSIFQFQNKRFSFPLHVNLLLFLRIVKYRYHALTGKS